MANVTLAPGPTAGFGLGNLRQLRQAPCDFLLGLSRQYPGQPLLAFRLGPRIIHLAVSPEAVRHVLVDNHLHYDKQTPGFDAVRELLREGLLTSEGALWRRQRRLAQPAFHKERLRHFAGLMVAAAEETCSQWNVGEGKEVDLSESMMRLTLKVAAQSLFGVELSEKAPAIQKALTFAMQEANRRILELVKIPRFVPTPRNLRARHAIHTLDEVVLGIIAQRRAQGHPREDLLSMLMEARDEDTGEGMSDALLRDEVMTLILAGHETSANALTWAFALLAQFPAVLERVKAELDEVLGPQAPTLEHLPRLTYTRRVLDEVLRLYPPAWVFSRRAMKADEICGIPVPEGAVVMVSPYVTHRQPSVFDAPESFFPDRFLPEGEKALPRFAYFPFGGGPRQCIGNHFALMEMTLVLAFLLQRVRPFAVAPFPSVEANITLRPAGGLRLLLKPWAHPTGPGTGPRIPGPTFPS